MAEIDFDGKSAVHTYHDTVPTSPLILDRSKSVNPTEGDNLIVHGDNLLAMKALLPHYAGRIDCIYIDPPFNTQDEVWTYNDNIENSETQEWLRQKKVDSADTQRHDKWACMMWPRLQLFKKLLSDGGLVFLSIDDNEMASLKLLCDEIFSEDSFVANFIWQYGPRNASHPDEFSVQHNYILCYRNSKMIKNVRWKNFPNQAVETIWHGKDVGTTLLAIEEIRDIFKKAVFETPKPQALVEHILHIGADKNSIILDAFAGSGTTAHAVLNLNKKDGGDRKFILIEREDYANTITAERVRRAIRGIPDSEKFKKPLGGSFKYCILG